MRVLIACEMSGVVRDAFIALGHDAWSCDIIPSERRGPHIVNDVRNVLDWNWDLMICHPPCTYLSYAGARWFKVPGRMDKAQEAYKFAMTLWNAPIPLIAMENPRGLLWKWFRKPDEIVHPYHFGDPMTKATCLWLKGLPLMASLICVDPFVNWTKKGPHAHNGKSRSRTFPGIAAAMASQWGYVA